MQWYFQGRIFWHWFDFFPPPFILRFDFPSLFFSHTNTRIGGGGGKSPSPDIFWENTRNTFAIYSWARRAELLGGGVWGAVAPGNFLKIGLKLCFFRSILNMLEEILLHVIHWVIQGREFMTFIWRLMQGREFTINCSFNFFFLPLFHPLNFGCSQNLPVQLHYDPTCKICINMCTKRNYSQFREGN